MQGRPSSDAAAVNAQPASAPGVPRAPASSVPVLLPRRHVLGALSALGVGGFLGACGSGEDGPPIDAAPGAAAGSAGQASALGQGRAGQPGSAGAASAGELPGETSCVLTPAQTEGPFFFDTGLSRGDLREGKPGVTLELSLRVVDADGCTPLEGALVEVWHADAAGIYSAFNRADGNSADALGETFLRGVQRTDADGRVRFVSIYPGWYPGRTPHIHLMVLVGETRLLTTQLYFPENVTDAVYASAPYNERGPRTTTNATDSVGGVADLVGQLVPSENGYSTSFRLVVERLP
jgi:protocatechuate 3,4-dioxygenase beta subunit